MNYNLDQQLKMTSRVGRLFVAALAFGCVFGTVAHAQTQPVTPPATDPRITPSSEHTAFLVGRAEGTQGYTCLPTTPGASTASWTVKGARPEATLFSAIGLDFQIITHFLSPNTNPNDDVPRPLPFGNATWQSSFDSSKVWAQVPILNGTPAAIPAGSDASCPNTGSIACLLLEAVGTQEGPTGGRALANTTFIQRLNTNGGSAPTAGCFTSADVGNQALVPYTADYVFFRKAKK
ncbi:MAG TPA: DUF3455 domain-containing protein [Bryobacteraceae bacterium]|nr:DUF3455 domain-containing protein [Bryobacteraceae bacterium]